MLTHIEIHSIKLAHLIRHSRTNRIQEEEHHQELEDHQADHREDPQGRHEGLLEATAINRTTIAIDERAADETTRLTLRSLKYHHPTATLRMTRRRSVIETECNSYHTVNNRTSSRW